MKPAIISHYKLEAYLLNTVKRMGEDMATIHVCNLNLISGTTKNRTWEIREILRCNTCFDNCV